MIRTHRSFPLVIAASLLLATGLCCTAIIVSLIQQTLLADIPGVKDLKSLAALKFGSAHRQSYISHALFKHLEDTLAFEGMMATLPLELPVTDEEATQGSRVACEFVTLKYFEVLGVALAEGRTFADLQNARQAVAVISERLRRRFFGSNATAAGQTIRTANHDILIVGVVDKVFQGFFPKHDTDLWLPIYFYPGLKGLPEDLLSSPQSGLLPVVYVRMNPPERAHIATARLDAFNKGFDASAWGLPDGFEWILREDALASPEARNRVWRILRPLMIVTFLILATTTFNATGMLIARSLNESGTWALKNALGAGPARLLREEAIKAFWIACMATVLALGLALIVRETLPHVSLSTVLPQVELFQLTGLVLVLTFGTSLIVALICGCVPALVYARRNFGHGFREHDARGSASQRGQRIVAVVQVGGSFALVLTSLLFLRSVSNLNDIETGLSLERCVTAHVALNENGYDPGLTESFLNRLRVELERSTSIGTFGFAASPTLVPAFQPVRVTSETNTGLQFSANQSLVSRSYFAAVGLPLLQGSTFLSDNSDSSRPIPAILSQGLANQLWPAQNPIGRFFRLQGQRLHRVDGIVPDHRPHTPFRVSNMVYLPVSHYGLPLNFFIVAEVSSSSAAKAMAELESSVRRIDAGVMPTRVESLKERQQQAFAKWNLYSKSASLLAFISLIITGLSIWGLTAAQMRLRRAEVGIRIALGARSSDIITSGLAQAVRLLLTGLALGATALFVVRGILAAELFNVTVYDPVSLATALLVTCSATLVATYIPLRRTRSIDAAALLRTE